MKSILYVGATLMIGASVYGFVDYKQTSQKKEFNNMYAEEKKDEPVVTTVTEKKADPVVSKTEEKKTKTVSKKTAGVKEDVLPAIKPIAAEDKIRGSETKEIGTSAVTVVPVKENNVTKKVKKRKLNTKLFSRGALDERYIEPKVKKSDAKEDKKSEDKEQ